MTKAKTGISSFGTALTFFKVGTCSETLIKVLNRSYDNPLEVEENASKPLAGGIMHHGYQCGMIWGATLAAGAQAYRIYGTGQQSESRALLAAQKLVASFRDKNKSINCSDIAPIITPTKMQIFKFLLKGGPISCVRMSAKYAEDSFREIDDALSEKHIKVPLPPVSCTALLAEKMGASERHTAMTAGLAGGIGLSGGACGALGAAIWIIAMDNFRENGVKIDFQSPVALNLFDRFMKCTNSKFECSEIVGKKFGNIEDHSDYLRSGGCSEIIKTLAGRG